MRSMLENMHVKREETVQNKDKFCIFAKRLNMLQLQRHNMKKLLLTWISLLLVSLSWAAKAWKMPLTVTQPDGSVLQAYQHGDEHFNWYTDKDGVILIRKADIFYIAHIDRYGKISSSNLLAHEKSQRQDAEKRAVAAQNRNLFFEKAQQRIETRAMRREPVQVDNTFFPHMGSPKAIVILAQYNDTPFTLTNPRQSFQQFLNGEGEPVDYEHGKGRNASSVKQYFKDMSFGKFIPQFDVYGPVTLPHELAYYGGTDPNGGGEKFSELITDACQLMDDSLNFANYDANGDGYADLVYVVYSGYGQNMGAPDNTMWPKAGTIYPCPSFDGKKICRAGISNELIGNPKTPKKKMISGIGLFCHEFSHCMGLPDFYPTLASARGDNQGMEAWSLMDDGEYTANGWWPTAYTAWEREAMGWMTIDNLTTAQQIELQTIDNKGKAYRIYNDNDPSTKDYYIVQNIQAKRWNAGLKSHGLLMYHVNYEATAFILSSNSVNNVKGKPRMTVIPADGLLYSSYNGDRNKYKEDLKGDLFPGTKNVTKLTDANNLPNYAPWTGGTLDKPIYNISERDGKIYFDFLRKVSTDGIEQATYKDRPVDERIYTLDGRYVGTDDRVLEKGIYIRNHKKFVKP